MNDSNNCLNKGISMTRTITLTYFLLLSWSVFAQETYQLSEEKIKDLSLEVSPQWENIEAAFLVSKNESLQLEDRFKPVVFGEANYAETRERAIIQFIPIWSPAKTAQVGVRQNFKSGVSLSGGLGTDQRSALTSSGKFKNVSTSVLRLDIQVDLWKDLLGKLSKAQTQSAMFSKEKAEHEKQIQQKSFILTLRKTYWSLVANNELINISKNLLNVSKDQLADSRKRRQAGITDDGEVARYEAQVASREGNILFYEYQREIIFKQLRMLLPALVNKNIVLQNYDLSLTLSKVLACTELIASKKEVPLDFTQYDEVIEFLHKTQTEQLKLADAYDQIDLKFVGTAKTTGVSSTNNGNGVTRGSYGDSFDDFQDNNRTGYSVGLNLAIPFGKGETKNTQEQLAQKRFSAQIDQSKSELGSTHKQLVKNIQLLTSVIRFQKENSLALEKRLRVQNRKFKEARVSVNDLIMDQDSLLSSSISVINSQLELLNIIFDYLSVFTETPCEFNRI
jgi:outer membrane protein TolC